MAVVKQGLKGSNLISNNNRKTTSSDGASKISYGKVFGVVNGINLPTPKMYDKVKGRLGTVFYLDAEAAKTNNGIPFNDNFLDTCLIAYPSEPNIQYYPLLQEIVKLAPAPSIDTPNIRTTTSTIYWSRVINISGDSQQNAQSQNSDSSLGKTFEEDSNNKNLISYEGDYILSGRKGNSIRFSSTVGLYSIPGVPNYNEWSSVGKNGSPILILSNGHNYNSYPSILYTEQINRDASSIYLTSTQTLPIEIDSTGLKSPLIGEPVSPEKYNNPQVILNGDRILINSKKDEILLFSKTNTILKSNGINLVGNSIELLSNDIYLGKNSNGDLPSEPALLGQKTIDMFEDLVSSMQLFLNSISSAVDSNGVPIAAIKSAADKFNQDLERVSDKLDPDNIDKFIASNQVFIT
jgi:hypothetical protein